MIGPADFYTSLAIAACECAVFVASSRLIQRYPEQSPKVKAGFWGCGLATAAACAVFFKSCLAAQIFALPLMGMVLFGHTLRQDLKAKRPAWFSFGIFVSAAGLLICTAIFSVTIMLGALFLPSTNPPTKDEVFVLVSKVGAERLRADATSLRFPQDGLPRYDLPKETWPSSFSELKPVGIRVWDVKEGVVTIYLHKFGDAEIVVEVLPVGLQKQIETGAIAPQSPYRFWRENIADGVYWRSTLDSK